MNIHRRTLLVLASAAVAAALAVPGIGVVVAVGSGAAASPLVTAAPMCLAGDPGCRDQAPCIGVKHDGRCHHNSHHGDRMRAVSPGGRMAGA